MPPRAIPMRLQRNLRLLRLRGRELLHHALHRCTMRCIDTAGCSQSQRSLHWRASQTSRFEMGNFEAELRPIGQVFPSWKLNLASFGLEIVQAPLRHPATQHEQHLPVMNVAVGRHPVTGVVDFEQQGGAAAVVGRITDQGEAHQALSCSGRSSWGKSGIGVAARRRSQHRWAHSGRLDHHELPG